METSLIGKAVDFGSKEYGFEPRVSKFVLLYLCIHYKSPKSYDNKKTKQN